MRIYRHRLVLTGPLKLILCGLVVERVSYITLPQDVAIKVWGGKNLAVDLWFMVVNYLLKCISKYCTLNYGFKSEHFVRFFCFILFWQVCANLTRNTKVLRSLPRSQRAGTILDVIHRVCCCIVCVWLILDRRRLCYAGSKM